MKERKTLSLALKCAILIFGFIGQTMTFGGLSFMSGAHMMYYTNQSNIIVMLMAAVFLFYDIRAVVSPGAAEPPRALLTARYIATVCITLTFVVFSLLLTPGLIKAGHGSYLFSMSNLCVHNIVPLLAVADWCVRDYSFKTGPRGFLWGAVCPLAYVFYALGCSFAGVTFAGQRVPYFFFDYVDNGWFTIGGGKLGTAWWILLLAGAVLAMGRGFIFIKDARLRARERAN